MRKIFFIFTAFFYMVTTNSFALDSKSHEKVNLCINMQGVNACDMVEEKDVYKIVYDQKYDSYFTMAMENFDAIGFDSSYFVDDMKKYTQCYAEAFAKEISIEDVNMIYNENISQTTRDAIINNIANKKVEKCKSKYAPYLNGDLENIIAVYVEKVCGSSKPSKSVAKKCKKQFSNADDIMNCQKERDEVYKCMLTVTQELVERAEKGK